MSYRLVPASGVCKGTPKG